MGLFDTVKCEYPLPDPAHQELEFQTKDFDCLLERYTIARDGRLVRHAQPGGWGSRLERDVEWPIHGDVRIYERDPSDESRLVEYLVRFTHGRVDWVRRADAEPASGRSEAPHLRPGLPIHEGLVPGLTGRRLTVEEFSANTPEKLELFDGRIPGDDRLLLLLLVSIGLRRVATLSRPELWMQALSEDQIDRTVDSDSGAANTNHSGEVTLLVNLHERQEELKTLLNACSDHWGFEDPVYRFYHQSLKVYWLQGQTEAIVTLLTALSPPGRQLNPWFVEIVKQGTGKLFRAEDNAAWLEITRPMIEAFFHARFFLEMAVRYAHLDAPPSPLPSGYAALLYLYGLR